MENLVYLKLVTGEYVIGQEIDGKIKKPVSIVFDPMQGGLGFMPYDAVYLMTEVQEISFKDEVIMHKFTGNEIPKEIVDKYREFVTGLVGTPEAGVAQNPSGIIS